MSKNVTNLNMENRDKVSSIRGIKLIDVTVDKAGKLFGDHYLSRKRFDNIIKQEI